ncbi:MAG: phosphate acyltransferase PlsX [Pseudomonadota bacterium]
MTTIALDAMGGDHGPPVTIAAAQRALTHHRDLQLVLVGEEETLREACLARDLALDERVRIEHATQVVLMDDKPSTALRGKRDSSMRVAINLVRDGQADACVSAGNTGALMAIARFVLKTLPGVDRPAICAAMPGIKGHTYVLDLGANVDSSSEELFRFAVMGSVLVESVDNRASPTVALLNIGEEEIKGNDRVKQTASLLEKSSLNYAGFAEGDDIFKTKYDVVVCDGFVGNVALKASEGVARLLADMAREEFTRNPWNKISALFAKSALSGVKRRADPRQYNGASLLGLKGIVIKSHGSADAMSFSQAINVAVLETTKRVPERISEMLEEFLVESE